jgi:ABC-type dipeptide/oligopeptide/nickel transport system permease subunit
MIRALIRSPIALLGAVVVLFWIVVAVFAPVLAPFDPNATISPFNAPLSFPPFFEGTRFWLGTDQLGRDILSRIIWGSRTVLVLAPGATAAAYVVGIALGLAAGYKRGWVDEVLSRIGDLILSFPVLVLYVVIIATVGPSALNILIAMIFANTPGIMRIVRGLVLEVAARDFVAAARLRGESGVYVGLFEILPNLGGPLIVDACLRLGYVVITIGALGFLGLGLPPPDPDWGGMINEGRRVALSFPYMTVAPCAALSSLVLGFNLLADGLRRTGQGA